MESSAVEYLGVLSARELPPELLAELAPLLGPKPELIRVVLGALRRTIGAFFDLDRGRHATDDLLMTETLWGCDTSGFELCGSLLRTDAAGRIPWLEALFAGYESNDPDFTPPCWPYFPRDWSDPSPYGPAQPRPLNWNVAIGQIRRGFEHLVRRVETARAVLAGTEGLGLPEASAWTEEFCFARWPEYCLELDRLSGAACAHLGDSELRGAAGLEIPYDYPYPGVCDCGSFGCAGRFSRSFDEAPVDGFASIDFADFRILHEVFVHRMKFQWSRGHLPPLLALPSCVGGSGDRLPDRAGLDRAAAKLARLVDRIGPAVRSLPQL